MANWAGKHNLGDPKDPNWQAKMLKEIKASNGQSWKVLGPAAPAFQGLLGDLEAAGYNPTSSGGFNYRTIRGSDKLSQHAFGNSIDINAASNPMLKGQLKTDMPASIAEIAAKHNLEWGGNWKNRPDPMHFEWKGGDVSEALKQAGISLPTGLMGNTGSVAAAPGALADAGISPLPQGGAGAFGLLGPQSAAPAAAPAAVPAADPAKDKAWETGIAGLTKAMGAGQQQQQEVQMPGLSNFGSELAARMQPAQSLMAQLLAMKQKPKGLI